MFFYLQQCSDNKKLSEFILSPLDSNKSYNLILFLINP